MSDDVLDMMVALRDDPEELRHRRRLIETEIAREETSEAKPRRLLVDVELDPAAAKMFRVVEIFLSAMRGREDLADTLKYVLMSGLDAEMERFGQVRDRVYGAVGIAEGLTVETTTEEEREILEVPAPLPSPTSPGASDYWKAGYVTTRCPQCGKQAFWHPETKQLDCTVEGPIGQFDEMPRGGKK